MSTTFYGSTISSCWRAYGTYSTSETNTAVTVSLVGGFQTISWRFWISYVDCTAYIGSSSTATTNNSVHESSSGTYKHQMVSKSSTFSKTTSAQTITLKIVTYNHSSYKNGTSTATATITVPALTSYTIKYNANGGSGAPSSQTKYYGKTLTLSSTKPTRTNYTFLGWSTSSSATTATYSAGGSYTANSAATLYAVWELNHTSPTISSVSVYRCDSDGSSADTGTYIYTGFKWSISDDYEVSSISVAIASSSAGTSTTNSISASGDSGTVAKIFGSSFSADYDYTVTITVTDTASTTTTSSKIVGSTHYIIDFLSGGTGMAIGKAATEEDLFDCALPANFDEYITINREVDSPAYIEVNQGDDDNVMRFQTTSDSTGGVYDITNSRYLIYRNSNDRTIIQAKDGMYAATDNGNIKLPIIQRGYISITPSAANTPTAANITFGTEFTTSPYVFAMPSTAYPGTVVLGLGVQSISTTGATLYLTRTNTTSTGVYWIAVGY